MSEGIESTRFDQRLDNSLSPGLLTHASQEVIETSKRFLSARLNNRLNDVVTDVSNSLETKANVVSNSRKNSYGFIDIRSQDLDSHPATLV